MLSILYMGAVTKLIYLFPKKSITSIWNILVDDAIDVFYIYIIHAIFTGS